jgi:hypothetical protein
MARPARARRSPITAPGYGRGQTPGNKGMKLPAEILSPQEVQLLLSSFGSSRTDTRNYAIVALMYRAGLKVGEIVALERRHFELGREKLTIPATRRVPQREVTIDVVTREALERWITVRKRAEIRATAPLFCALAADTKGRRLHTSYLRELFSDKALSLGIDRRVTAEGLRRSGIEHRVRSHGRLEAQIGQYLDEESFRLCYPDAYEKWQSALDLFAVHPERHATRIGHDCREVLLSFVDTALEAQNEEPTPGAGTVDKLRRLIETTGPRSRRVIAHCNALVGYWGTVSDLAQRQEHAAGRKGDALGAEDARRLIFHTMIVMFEVDRLRRASG